MLQAQALRHELKDGPTGRSESGVDMGVIHREMQSHKAPRVDRGSIEEAAHMKGTSGKCRPGITMTVFRSRTGALFLLISERTVIEFKFFLSVPAVEPHSRWGQSH